MERDKFISISDAQVLVEENRGGRAVLNGAAIGIAIHLIGSPNEVTQMVGVTLLLAAGVDVICVASEERLFKILKRNSRNN